jgi:hypothetical protein
VNPLGDNYRLNLQAAQFLLLFINSFAGLIFRVRLNIFFRKSSIRLIKLPASISAQIQKTHFKPVNVFGDRLPSRILNLFSTKRNKFLRFSKLSVTSSAIMIL